MRIKNITLHNFGSYRGNNQFHFEVNRSGKRVVVIGGKNGAGKTTLFTAIQVCLYGNFAYFKRSTGGIAARLVRLGKITARDEFKK